MSLPIPKAPVSVLDEQLEFWRNRPDHPGFVYAAQYQPETPVKIGHTTREVRERFADFQTAHYEELHLLAVLPGTRELEWQLHERLRSRRIRRDREWFEYSSEVIELLALIAEVSRQMILATGDTGLMPDPLELLGFRYYRRRSTQPVLVSHSNAIVLTDEEREARRRQQELEAERRREAQRRAFEQMMKS